MEQVLMVTYDKAKFAGEYITEEERIKNDLPKLKPQDNDELWA